jgi:hypothetical protein
MEILTCDSSLGVVVYFWGIIGVIYLPLLYLWIIWRIITDVRQELMDSPWVHHTVALHSSLQQQTLQYEGDYSWHQRWYLGIQIEKSNQIRYYNDILTAWIVSAIRGLASITKVLHYC